MTRTWNPQKPTCKGPTSQGGFSLIEVLVVVAIMAATLVITIPNFVKTISRTKIRSAAEEVYNAVSIARGRAIAENVDYRVEFDIVNNTYSIVPGVEDLADTAWTADTAKINASTQLLRYQNVTLPNDVEFLSPNGGSKTALDDMVAGDCNCVRFTPMGTRDEPDAARDGGDASHTSGIQFGRTGQEYFYQVHINAFGIVKVKKWADSESDFLD